MTVGTLSIAPTLNRQAVESLDNSSLILRQTLITGCIWHLYIQYLQKKHRRVIQDVL